jgi:hypothetical protein
MAATDPKHDKGHGHDHGHGNSGYEVSDANIKAVLGVAVGVLVFSIACAVIVQGMFWWFEKGSTTKDLPKTERAKEEGGKKYDNEPALQESPEADMIQFRKEQNAELGSYGWVNKEKGVVRIPVEEAMKLTLQRGLPTSKTVPVFNAPNGTGHPAEVGGVLFDKEEVLRHSGDSNSGRALTSKAKQ